MCMKTYYWFNPNRLLSHLRIATAGRRPHLRPGFVLTALALALAGLVLSPQARAVCQQGCDLTNHNTFLGDDALLNNTTGFNNTATAGNWNTAEGLNALLHNTGTSNIALGFNAGVNLTNGRNNIDIGAPGVAGEASTIRIGVQGTQARTFVAGISGSPITGTSVVVSGVGRLGTVASSQRFKDDIKPMDKASEAILALKPVTFHYKKEVDPDGI